MQPVDTVLHCVNIALMLHGDNIILQVRIEIVRRHLL